MAEERIDVVLQDKVSDAPKEKLLALAKSAREAYEQVEALQSTLRGINAASLRKLQGEMDAAATGTTRQAAALARLEAAQARTDAAIGRATLQQQRATSEAERTALAAARVTTEMQRTATAAVATEIAKERLNQVTARSTRGMEQEGDAAVALYQKITQLRAANAAAGAQGAFNAVLNVAPTSGQGSARASASVFAQDARDKEAAAKATENLTKRADALRVAIDPLYAAQQRYNREMAEANALRAAGAISEATYGQAVAMSTAAMQQATGVSKRMSDQTKMTRFQMLTLQYTVNDVIASLASGASPMTILMQQGGQVAQAWGGLTNTLRAAGAALATPVGMLGALAVAAGGAVLIAERGTSEFRGFQRSLDLTGGSAGMTAGNFVAMSAQIAEATNTSVASARTTAMAYASTGQLQRNEILLLTTATQNFARASGQSTDAVVKKFATMTDSPSKFAREFSAQYNILTTAQYEYIRALEDAGRKSEAITATSKILYDYYKAEATDNLGILESAWRKVAKAISDAYTNAKNFGRSSSLQEQLKDAEDRLAQLSAPTGAAGPSLGPIAAQQRRGYAEAQRLVASLREQVQISDAFADSKARAAEAERQGTAASENISRLSGEIADNSVKAEQAVAKFRKDLEALGRTNPTGDTYLNAIKNQEKIEKGIRKKYMPEAAKGDKKAENEAEARKLAMALVNAELDKQITGLGVLAEERQKQQKLDEVEIGLARKKIELTGAERDAIALKINQIVESARTQAALDAAYEQAIGPLRNYATAVEAASVLFQRQRITYAEMIRQQAVAKEAYLDMIDPLRSINREMTQQERLIGLVGRAREVETAQIAAENALRQRNGGVISEANRAALDALRIRQDAQIRQQQVDKELNSIYDDTVGKIETITVKQTALNQAMQRGYISVGQYGQSMAELRAQLFDAKTAMGTDTFSDRMEASFDKNIKTMEDTLVNFVMTGKFEFKGLVTSILADLARLEMRRQVMAPIQASGGLMNALGSLFGPSLGPEVTGPTTGDFSRMDRVSLPSYDVGIPWVPTDRIAKIHKGERVLTAQENARTGGGGKPSIVYAPQTSIQVDSRSDRAQVLADVSALMDHRDKQQRDYMESIGFGATA